LDGSGSAPESSGRRAPSRSHDAWEQVVGETLVHADVIAGLDFEEMERDDWDPRPMTRAVQAWLRDESRLLEVRSGEAMSAAYYVRLADGEDVVAEVLCSGD
jgi:hypothetical protein